MMKYFIAAYLLLAVFYCTAQIRPRDSQSQADSVSYEMKEEIQENLPTIIISDDESDNGDSNPVSSVLTAGRDPFLSAAAFNFSAVQASGL